MSKYDSEKVVKDIRRNTRRKYSAEEKIRIVLDGLRGEDSIAELSVRRTLRELDVSRSSFYRWYRQYLDGGPEALQPASRSPRCCWNQIPETVKAQCLEIALQYPELSSRELAWTITDKHGYFISESSVYRLLKQYDLITSPAYSTYVQVRPVRRKVVYRRILPVPRRLKL